MTLFLKLSDSRTCNIKIWWHAATLLFIFTCKITASHKETLAAFFRNIESGHLEPPAVLVIFFN
jgi:hypothetical protein